MGEMADFVGTWQHWDGHDEFTSDEEVLYDYGGEKACRCCGASYLHWGRLETGKWVLCNRDGTIHECPVRPLASIRAYR